MHELNAGTVKMHFEMQYPNWFAPVADNENGDNIL